MSEEVTPTPVVTETPAETPPVEAPKEAPKTPEFMSEKFHALAKKEKSIVKARQEIALQRAQFDQEKSLQAKDLAEFQRWKQLKDNAKLDPDAYLQEAGLSYGSLTERNLQGGLDPKAILEKTNQTIAAFKKEQEDAKKLELEAQKTQSQKEYETRVTNYVNGIYEFVDQNKETYELTHLNDQQSLIWDVIKLSADRGKEMTVKEAAQKVEDYLTERVEKSVLGSKKFKDKFSSIPKPEEAKPGAPTLSNNMTTSTQPKAGLLTDAQRTQNALAALNKALGE